MNALIETDPNQAKHLYLHAARALERQIAKALGYLPNKRLLAEAEAEAAKRAEGDGVVSDDRLVKAESEVEVPVPMVPQPITA
jgi:hypothetical protein